MSQKILLIVLILILSFVPLSSADAIFTNDLKVHDRSIDFTINEAYSGIDAEAFRLSLDTDNNSIVSEQEVEAFVDEFKRNSTGQYLGYVLIDNGNTVLSLDSFDMQLSGAEGNVNTSEIKVTANIIYGVPVSLEDGKHSIWILGHPAIEKMSISFPSGIVVKSIDGIDELQTSCDSGRQLFEGRSGIRSFIVDDQQTFEYAVMIETGRSKFIADLSRFPSLF
ncbi:hypothetical protein SAMN04488589_1892 [Methanolobus vulcani]|jgi:hypothetical protein|uniref:Uncharacterized protein n=1 Tax=Methanolobus vulcani TaxID=38026 RepID=A0A7Z7B2D9_9EURY|nr:hypothetical protein [Methanolobus vulcani]MDK2826218.1 hypothetical protein [Methanolobus sp.]SDG00581.1 hypothetical protein SAMN04488589_1892 [Methanolobus vulcani]